MSMVPWENAILVPAADVRLPVWLEPTAAMLGFRFPDVSERALIGLGATYARLARNFEQTRVLVDEAGAGLLSTNHGEALVAFTGFRERLSGPNASHMIVSASAAGAISAAYLAAGATVLAMKLKVTATLADAFVKSEAVTALMVAEPVTAPAILKIRAALATLVTTLNTVVPMAEKAVTTLLQTAARAIELYTGVATPLLRNRPMARQRETDTYLAVTGGLASHEESAPRAKDGGHTLSRHVNVNDRDIIERILRGEAKEASRWTDQRTAERVVAEVIAANPGKIATWLAGTKPNLRLDLTTFLGTTGRYVTETDRMPIEVTGARVILKRDPTRPAGYVILTSFPQP